MDNYAPCTNEIDFEDHNICIIPTKSYRYKYIEQKPRPCVVSDPWVYEAVDRKPKHEGETHQAYHRGREVVEDQRIGRHENCVAIDVARRATKERFTNCSAMTRQKDVSIREESCGKNANQSEPQGDYEWSGTRETLAIFRNLPMAAFTRDFRSIFDISSHYCALTVERKSHDDPSYFSHSSSSALLGLIIVTFEFFSASHFPHFLH